MEGGTGSFLKQNEDGDLKDEWELTRVKKTSQNVTRRGNSMCTGLGGRRGCSLFKVLNEGQ